MIKICLQSGHYSKGGGEISSQYVAGFLDGEGWFRIAKREYKFNPNYQIIVGASNTDRTVLDLMVKKYGGSVKSRPSRNGWKPEFSYATSCLKAEKLIKDVFPYLILKKDRAELCLILMDYIQHGTRRSLTQVDNEKRETIFQKIRGLNKKGIKND